MISQVIVVKPDLLFYKRQKSLLTKIKSIFANKQLWLIATFSAITYLAIEYLSENAKRYKRNFISCNK